VPPTTPATEVSPGAPCPPAECLRTLSKWPVVTDASKWFADEILAHSAQLKGYLRRTFPAVRDVDDVVQESYLRVWRARAADSLYAPKAFLFTVARRLALDWLRDDQRSPIREMVDPAELGVLDEGPGVEELVSGREKVEILSEALLTLPPRCRTVVMLYKLNGQSRYETARHLGISEKTVDEQTARGVRRLEAYFKSRGVEQLFES